MAELPRLKVSVTTNGATRPFKFKKEVSEADRVGTERAVDRKVIKRTEGIQVAKVPPAAELIADAEGTEPDVLLTKHITPTSVNNPRSLRKTRLDTVERHQAMIRISGTLSEANKIIAESDGMVARGLEKAQQAANAEGRSPIKRPASAESLSSRLIVPINPEDSTLVAMIKEILIRNDVRVSDLYDLLHEPDFHWLNTETQVYNYIYALRSRTSINFETAERWMAMLGCRLSISVEKLSFNELKQDDMYKHMREVTDVLESPSSELATQFLTKEDIDRHVFNRTVYDVSSIGEPAEGFEENLRSRPVVIGRKD